MTTQLAEHIPMSRWSKNHWSLLGYVECRCVDQGGLLDRQRMSCNPDRHPGLALAQHAGWEDKYSTRLADGSRIAGHDDWDVLDDLEAAGLVAVLGTGVLPVCKLTVEGRRLAAQLRKHKAAGGVFATFVPQEET